MQRLRFTLTDAGWYLAFQRRTPTLIGLWEFWPVADFAKRSALRPLATSPTASQPNETDTD
ncbi:MAG TPA: hypothetical protein PLB25_13555 [Rhodoferax sp.]|mgnify:CR=1 FL=1|nr:hypothetical protein [Rhodoferax sp.]